MMARKRWLPLFIALAGLALAAKMLIYPGSGLSGRPATKALHTHDRYSGASRLGLQRIGMTAEPLDAAARTRLHMPATTRGLVVTSLAYNGPAARAGLVIGDVIETIDGQPIADITEANTLLRHLHPVTLRIIHDGTVRLISIE